MPKRKPATLYRFFIYFFGYIILLCFSLRQYYNGYYLLESGVVLQDAAIVSVLCLGVAVFFFWYKAKPVIAKVYAGHWRNNLNGILVAVFFAYLLCLLLLGCIAAINSGIGPQRQVLFNAMLVNVKKETGRGGMNVQYYYKFYHFDSTGVYKNYVLRSSTQVYFEKEAHLKLTKGCLGILYAKE